MALADSARQFLWKLTHFLHVFYMQKFSYTYSSALNFTASDSLSVSITF